MTDTRQVHTEGTEAGVREWSTPATAPKPTPPASARDPRYLALRNFAISISVFNILGYTVLGFEQPWIFPLLALATAYSAELLLELSSAWATRRRPAFLGNGLRGFYTFLLPAHITALAVNMLLYTNDRFGAVAFGVIVGIGAKYVLRAPVSGKMRHFMNPSNFGISVTLLVFSSWIAIAPPYEFTENIPDVFSLYIPLVIATAGTVINAQLTKKIPLIAGWAGSFVVQALLRHYIWGVGLWTALSVLTGVAFVLFTNYMITDPGTTPRSGRAQFMFGSSVGIVYGVLMLCNVVYTLFFALSIVCLARGAFWWAHRFWPRRAEGPAGAARPE
jgi:hypothetical protein